MSSTFLVASADLASGLNAPECAQSASAKSILSAGASSQSTGPMSHAITISELSPPPSPMSFVAGSHANRSLPPLVASELRLISGPKCSGSSAGLDPASSSQKTSKRRQSPSRLNVSMDLAIQRTTAVYRALMQGQTIKEAVGGLLHTPTRKANFVAPSMQKWPSCRRFVLAFGGREITAEQFEFLMGLPIGWTELGPSETRSFRKSQKRSAERS